MKQTVRSSDEGHLIQEEKVAPSSEGPPHSVLAPYDA
jgi:hypothetical protein